MAAPALAHGLGRQQHHLVAAVLEHIPVHQPLALVNHRGLDAAGGQHLPHPLGFFLLVQELSFHLGGGEAGAAAAGAQPLQDFVQVFEAGVAAGHLGAGAFNGLGGKAPFAGPLDIQVGLVQAGVPVLAHTPQDLAGALPGRFRAGKELLRRLDAVNVLLAELQGQLLGLLEAELHPPGAHQVLHHHQHDFPG